LRIGYNGLRLKAVRAITKTVGRKIKVKTFYYKHERKTKREALIASQPLLADVIF